MKPGFASALSLSLLAACGVKGPPIPPSELLLPPPARLEAQVREGCANLSWKTPDKLPTRYLVLRRVADENEARTLADLPAAEQSFSDCRVPAGQIAIYQVQSLNAQGKAGPPSPEKKVFLAPPPKAPASLKAEPGDGFAQLCWTNPASPPRPAGFRLYRALEAGPFGRDSINPEPVSGPCWVDGNLTNGQPYRYVARSVKKTEAGIEIEGPASEEVRVIPEDIIPPFPPTELVAAPSAQGVVLHWNRNLEPDLRGYHVYRRLKSETRSQRITPEPLPAPEFLDPDPGLKPGREYIYTVTALDNAPEPNESKPSAPASVITLPR